MSRKNRVFGGISMSFDYDLEAPDGWDDMEYEEREDYLLTWAAGIVKESSLDGLYESLEVDTMDDWKWEKS